MFVCYTVYIEPAATEGADMKPEYSAARNQAAAIILTSMVFGCTGAIDGTTDVPVEEGWVLIGGRYIHTEYHLLEDGDAQVADMVGTPVGDDGSTVLGGCRANEHPLAKPHGSLFLRREHSPRVQDRS